MLVGESRVRLLSLQHNLITRLDGLQTLGINKLVFLDIYDNQLEKVAGLDTFDNLRVLLIGKNRLKRIDGLKSLTKLEVLDLHGNQITQVTGLNTLRELKVLNLAGNQIRVIGPNDLDGLVSLQELNLRRNRLKKLLGFSATPQLQKLFLSNNEIITIEDMSSVCKAVQLKEVTIDSNPVALGNDCVNFLVSYLPNLQLLSHMQVTDQIRKNAKLWRANREVNNKTVSPENNDVVVDIKRAEVISNARTNWELLRTQTRCLPMSHLTSSLKDLRSISEYDYTIDKMVQSDSVLSVASSITLSSRDSIASSKKYTNTAESRRTPITRRSFSEDTGENFILNSSEPIEYFKLPPILAPFVSEKKSSPTSDTSDKSKEKKCESGSSVDPIIDSSISSAASESTSGHATDTSEGEELEPETTGVAEKRENGVQPRKQLPNKKERPITGKSKPKPIPVPGKVREQGGDYLIEICGRCLNVYGQGALRFIDRPWNPTKAGDVTTVRFNYVNFSGISTVLGRLKQRFPNAENFIFRETNINCLGQLNALADVQGLTSLQIDPEGNPITQKEWRNYAIYRLAHWGLKIINGKEVTEEDLANAALEYQGLSDLVLWSLPDSLLQPLLSRLRIESNRSNPQQTAKQWLWNADPALRSVVGKEALQWRRGTLTQDDVVWRHKGRVHLSYMIELTCSAVDKLQVLESEWPTILNQLIRDTLVDYSQLDTYMKRCMQELQ